MPKQIIRLTRLTKRMSRNPRIDGDCWDLIQVPLHYPEISSNIYKIPKQNYELMLKRRGYCIVHRGSRRVLYDTGLNPISFSDIEVQITLLTKRRKNMKLYLKTI